LDDEGRYDWMGGDMEWRRRRCGAAGLLLVAAPCCVGLDACGNGEREAGVEAAEAEKSHEGAASAESAGSADTDSDSAERSESTADTVSPSAETGPTDVSTYVAWRLHETEAEESEKDAEWVAESGWVGADGELQARRDGVYIAVDERLWRYTVGAESRTLLDCECYEPRKRIERSYDEDEKRYRECLTETDVDTPEFHRVGADEVFRPLTGRGGEGGEEGESAHPGSYRASFVPRASVGPLLTTTECISRRYCGAVTGGGMSCTQRFWSLEGDTPREVGGIEDDFVADGKGLRERAFERYKERFDRPSDSDRDPVWADWSADEFSVTAGWPTASGGETRMLYQLTHRTSRAGTDGKWDMYTVSERLTTEDFPDAFEGFTEVPDDVMAFWQRGEDVVGRGFSETSGPGERP